MYYMHYMYIKIIIKHFSNYKYFLPGGELGERSEFSYKASACSN